MESGASLMLDFESEFAAFLNRDFPDISNQVRRPSDLQSSARTIEVGTDGTIHASALSYDVLVSEPPSLFKSGLNKIYLLIKS